MIHLLVLRAERLPSSGKLSGEFLFTRFRFSGQTFHHTRPLLLTKLEERIGGSFRRIRIGFRTLSLRPLSGFLLLRIVRCALSSFFRLRHRLKYTILLQHTHRRFAPTIPMLIQTIDQESVINIMRRVPRI